MHGALRQIPRGAQASLAHNRTWCIISHVGTLACVREGGRQAGRGGVAYFRTHAAFATEACM